MDDLKKVYLHGSLKDYIPGGVFECSFATAGEAASAIEVNFPGFFDIIRDMKLHIVLGDPANNESFDEDQIKKYAITHDEIHIMPALEGSGGGKKGGLLKVILGVALIAVAFVGTMGAAGAGIFGSLGAPVFGNTLGITGTQLLMFGASMVLSGLAQPPKKNEEQEQLKSAIYSGPINTQEPGAIVPYVAGKDVIVGGVVIHADIRINQVPA